MRTSRLLVAAGSMLAIVCAVSPRLALAATPPGTPMDKLKQTNERLDKLLKQKHGGSDAAAKTEMKEIVNGLLDYDELAKRSLGGHWEEITAAQRDEFVKTLRDLIEKNYIKQLQTNLDYEVQYKNEDVKGDDATVSTVVKVRTRGKSTDTPIDYKMRQQQGKWLVYDIITDDVSMVKNYKQQFNKIISSEKFEGLLKKMHNKVAEEDRADGKDGGKDDAKTAKADATATDKPSAETKAGAGKPAKKK